MKRHATLTLRIPGNALVLVMGGPGAGKSYFCQRHFSPAEIINPDSIRGQLTGDPANQAVNKQTFDTVHRLVESRLRQQLFTVIDATSLNMQYRQVLLGIAARNSKPVCAIVLDPPLAVCLERNRNRERVVPEDVVTRHHNRVPGTLLELKAEGVNPIFHGTDADFSNQVTIRRTRTANPPAREMMSG